MRSPRPSRAEAGLGSPGAGGGHPELLARELPILADVEEPWGVGFQTWAPEPRAVDQVLEHRPAAVIFSFGDPSPFVDRVHEAGVAVLLQVTDLEEAGQAMDLGADLIVAQGTESGGHGARHGRSTLPFVLVVVDLVAPAPGL
ncbi:nitronate monooxygenase [Streptomyces sp. NPDC058642]|uniref:nitronate monooxygenase n=1 Tax=Streptomyces sp. NPDC058642 TaxID=3346572 RepID=UPI00365DE89B